MFRFKTITFSLALLSVLFLSAPVTAQKTMNVQVKDGQLRSSPSFLSKIVARVSYGDRVAVLDDRGSWKKVSIPGGKLQGWMHDSALTTKRISLKAGQTNVQAGVTGNELALAGKGFSEQVEAAYRSENKALDYASINRMEAVTVSAEQIQDFIAGGGLALHEGGVNP